MYRPRRGDVVTELDVTDLEDVYAPRRLLETEAIRRGVPLAADADLARLRDAGGACRAAAGRGDLAGRLDANRAVHDALHALARGRPLVRLLDQLWDSTEAHRALHSSLPGTAAEAVASLQDAHCGRALERLRGSLAPRACISRHPRKGYGRPARTTDTDNMTWTELEEQWLRDGRHVYFAPDDEDGIEAFEKHLRRKRLRFVVATRSEVPAVVFARPPRAKRSTSSARRKQAA